MLLIVLDRPPFDPTAANSSLPSPFITIANNRGGILALGNAINKTECDVPVERPRNGVRCGNRRFLVVHHMDHVMRRGQFNTMCPESFKNQLVQLSLNHVVVGHSRPGLHS